LVRKETYKSNIVNRFPNLNYTPKIKETYTRYNSGCYSDKGKPMKVQCSEISEKVKNKTLQKRNITVDHDATKTDN